MLDMIAVLAAKAMIQVGIGKSAGDPAMMRAMFPVAISFTMRPLPWLALMLIPASLLAAPTAGEPVGADTRYVQGSWVNLRATAAADGAVQGQLTVNSRVRLLSRQGEWCEVRAEQPALQGFLTCRLLDAKPVALFDVDGDPARYDPKPEDLKRYNPPRAFWLSPSVARFLRSGQYFWGRMLPEAQQNGERNGQWGPDGERPLVPIRRFPVPEFEAMKALLAKGIRVNPAEVEPTAWMEPDGMSRYEEEKTRNTVVDAGFTTREMIRKGWLRGVKPSLFKSGADIAFDHAGLDRLAALSGESVRLRVLRGPEYYYDYDTQVVDGAWDVGEVAVDFDRPPVFHAVGKSGLVRKGLLPSRRMVVNHEDSRCITEGLHVVPTDVRPLPDTPKVSDPLVMFYLSDPLPLNKVAVTVRQATLTGNVPQELPESLPPVSLKTVGYDIDLNQDRIPDLAVWRSEYFGMISGNLPVVAIWANLAGVWRLVSFAAEPDCT